MARKLIYKELKLSRYGAYIETTKLLKGWTSEYSYKRPGICRAF